MYIFPKSVRYHPTVVLQPDLLRYSLMFQKKCYLSAFGIMKITSFGEVLFDIASDHTTLGGAPLNFIYHLAKFSKEYDLGIQCRLVSKVGNDQAGRRALDFIQKANIDVQSMQISEEHPTGKVFVQLDSTGLPEYEIIENVAWDYIDFHPFVNNYDWVRSDLLYLGTLCQRTQHNRQTLDWLFQQENPWAKSVYFDLNIRQRYYTKDIIENTLIETNFLKINEDELKVIEVLFFSQSKDRHLTENKVLDKLMKEYKLQAVLYTKGSKGASIHYADGTIVNHKAEAHLKVVDTIGAGDAFSSVFCLGVLLGWSQSLILERAIEFSGKICTIPGALPTGEYFYTSFSKWF